jgi:Uma2 family endonuclease
MSTTVLPPIDWLSHALLGLGPGERVYATGIPWAVYTRLADLRDARRPGVKITFDKGRIEVMSPLFRHERPSRRLGLAVPVLAEELGLELVGARSTTFRREEAEQGLEPDECFYVAHFRDVLGLDDIDLTIHPPPDLAIEIDATRSSVAKEAIYGPMGVPELWRLDEDEVTIRHLRPDRTYQTADRSLAFPHVTAIDLTRLLAEGRDEGEIAFIRRCRVWAKALVTPPAAP